MQDDLYGIDSTNATWTWFGQEESSGPDQVSQLVRCRGFDKSPAAVAADQSPPLESVLPVPDEIARATSDSHVSSPQRSCSMADCLSSCS
jgi:hypothetical protein